MTLPEKPVTLTPEQVEALAKRLSDTRHDINNHLSLIVAAVELLRRKPELSARMIESISQQPDRIIGQMRAFSADFEKTLGITRE